MAEKTKEHEYKYSFGVSNELIWTSHLLMGIFFIYVGYELILKRKISIPVALILVVLGAVGALYHAHLWYESLEKKII
jgi:Kef-type K+ transport system membrane component KefB